MKAFESLHLKAIHLTYDIKNSEAGLQAIKAFKLSPSAIKSIRLGDEGLEIKQKVANQNGLTVKNMFENLPLVVKRPHLVQAYLAEYICDKVEGSTQSEGEVLA